MSGKTFLQPFKKTKPFVITVLDDMVAMDAEWATLTARESI